ncbi:MAG TPA: DUF4203 domain-containing protein [Lacunisphaera sp.]|nr:DUF4203 domain-containing protein [Lacunisphaera sp.]
MHPDAELYPWVSAGAIAWGLLDCFFGYRIFKITLAILGGLVGVVFGQAAGAALGLGPAGEIGGMIVGGLLGLGLTFLLYLAAVFIAGFLAAATLAILLLANLHPMVALLAAGVIGLVGGYLALKLQRVVLVLATALLGAFRVVLATCYFTEQLDWIFYFEKPPQIPALVAGHPWMLPSVVALAAVGAVVQLGTGAKGGKKKAKEED